MASLTVREVLAQHELSNDDLEVMDYKDVAAHESAVLEGAGFNCPDGYNCPRGFNEWLRKELQIEAAYAQKADQQLDALMEEERCL